jgi:uncharacterized protein YkwD
MSHAGFSTRCRVTGMKVCGENLAWQSPPNESATVDQTHNAWMNSKYHKENIMRDSFNVVSYAYYICNGRIYWTGFYGKE